MAHAKRHGQKLAVHFMDLNRFKEVNDTLVHAVGDELLKAVGATLKDVVRDTQVDPTPRRPRDLEIEISIDDFGTGYASLTYLRQFPVTKVKIDMSFAQGITHDPADKAIVEAVIRLGHGLKLEVTAEGVETEDRAALYQPALIGTHFMASNRPFGQARCAARCLA